MEPERFFFHQATPPGEGAISLFELYGPSAEAWIRENLVLRGGAIPPPEHSRVGWVRGAGGDLVDEVVLSRSSGPQMWSRLPAWTIAAHGSPWLAARLASTLVGAGAEERDRRGVLLAALEGGAISAPEACAWELLVEARTEEAASFFLRQVEGELSAALREGIALARAGDVAGALGLARALLRSAGLAQRLSEPLRVMIAGRPNAGKSTLYNRLLGLERTVVNPAPGTTRDLIEETLVLDGFPILLADSAGLRAPAEADPLEQEGIQRALAWGADIVLYLVSYPWQLSSRDEANLRALHPAQLLLVGSQADLCPAGRGESGFEGRCALHVSSHTGEGLDAVRRALRERMPGTDFTGAGIPRSLFSEKQTLIFLERLAHEGLEPGGAAASSSTGHGSPPARDGGAAGRRGRGGRQLPLRDRLDAIEQAFLECLTASWP